MGAVSKEIAEIEIKKWLDVKKVRDTKRESYKESVATLVEAMCSGNLVLNEDNSLTHTLLFPVGADNAFKTLTYKSRLDVNTRMKYSEGVIGGEPRIVATIAALTGQGNLIIASMDTEDYGIASSVAIFFL